MSKAIDKLRSTSGETISEVLVGVLIVGLATVLFVAMVSAATSISNAGVQGATDAYTEMSAVDTASASEPLSKNATVTIKPESGASATLNVYAYTAPDDDGTGDLTRYQLVPAISEGN